MNKKNKFIKSFSEREQGEDFLSYHVRCINQFKMLDEEEESSLIKKWRETNDQIAAHTLIKAHLKLVVKIAYKYRNYGFPMEDLIAEGSVGIMKSLKGFDSSMGYRFSTYAMWWIKAEIKEYVMKSWSLVKIGTTAAQKRLFFSLRKKIRKLQEEKGSFAQISEEDFYEISKELKAPPQEIKDMSGRLGNRDFSLNASLNNQEDEEEEWQDTLVSSAPNQEDFLVEKDMYKKRSHILEKLLRKLSVREKDILFSRYLEEKPLTLDELGKKHDLSRERIRQIESSVLQKLKNGLALNNSVVFLE